MYNLEGSGAKMNNEQLKMNKKGERMKSEK
jgi:hypothetical protein